MADLHEMLAAIEARRAALVLADRAKLEADEQVAQCESWARAMAPCEHGDPDPDTPASDAHWQGLAEQAAVDMTRQADVIARQAGVIERLREALRSCRRAVFSGVLEPRRKVREIVDGAVEEYARAALTNAAAKLGER